MILLQYLQLLSRDPLNKNRHNITNIKNINYNIRHIVLQYNIYTNTFTNFNNYKWVQIYNNYNNYQNLYKKSLLIEDKKESRLIE